MTINLSVPQTMQELRPRITVVGVGGAGGNAVNNMINADLDGVDFLVANTDGQALAHSLASRKIQLGTAVTQGLGAGSKPDVGRAAAEESIEAVMSELADCNMVFITAGMGGGTGTGAAPVIARAARERGILTVGVVTKPFDFEGQRRMGQAEAGIEEMQSYVDTLIVIPNQNLFRLANERTTFADAFHMADTVLHQGVAGVTDLMIKPGQINLDFADIRAVMSEMGKAMMGTGEASGEGRATQAAEAAINNPLLDDISMHGARAVLINVTGGMDMTLFEVDEAANRIRREIDADSVIIFGSTFDEKLDGVMRVSIVATGIEGSEFTPRNTDLHPGADDPPLDGDLGTHDCHTCAGIRHRRGTGGDRQRGRPDRGCGRPSGSPCGPGSGSGRDRSCRNGIFGHSRTSQRRRGQHGTDRTLRPRLRPDQGIAPGISVEWQDRPARTATAAPLCRSRNRQR